jgi:isoaspartyl peptidase/L-asparaginase-like protein (Ntn-hydrolase superfamily)
MHGPKKRAGGVAAIEGVRTPSLVAQLVMEKTDHHLLVGKGAQEFARSMGFKIEDDLNTERSRKRGSNGSGAPIRCTTSIRRSARAGASAGELQMMAEG